MTDNLFRNIPDRADQEFVESLVTRPGARVERIVSRGHRSPEGFWYDQDDDEWVVLVRGRATLSFADGRTLEMQAGDHAWIPAHAKHRVDWTAPDVETVWVAVFIGR
ncbi:MAG: hypothetical protein DHS20C21_07320 [Gemmatimonadota bacterium]|nr:MAG: hypothetical protein DHS20C21_07320 [Gemmatimonadota bacterium]